MSLRYEDEPQDSGAVVAVNWGDYRRVELWIRSGISIGNWYYLGNETGRPMRGEIPMHPMWTDVLKRGPVTLLVPGDWEAYAAGWANGRRHLAGQVEALADKGPGEDGGDGQT